ncbi:hypothetical protein NIES4075_20170 [Tolypothrix sp. NIES-4075]|uniref:hypothetical protein n=1 Tax=Tolypothrix sp. NIES-4075 TaxID=2005459 RepID=UPI000B5CDA8C|nr:hypothetical protein [Tolypothrix sp. NIES-4075]GAX41049.1 hypothetical protein NIES4075_20170 [Tolypothrix sp. NIES-4075]
MDIALLVKFLAPCLPFLLKVGNKAVEGASEKVGEDVWNKAKAIWAKLHPKVEAKEAAKEAATDVAQKPEDEDLQASFRVQLKKILDADTPLAEEITKILQKTDTRSDGSSSNVNAPQSYDDSTQLNTGRDVINPNLSRTYNNPK